MRTIIKEIKLYNVDDLKFNFELKNLLLTKYREINTQDYPWYLDVEADCIEMLEEKGFINPQINFTISHRQGDGASFTCKEVNINKLLKHTSHFTLLEIHTLQALYARNLISIRVMRDSSLYYHERTVSVIMEEHIPCKWRHLQKIVNKLHYYLNEEIVRLSRFIYKDLRSAYKHFTSDAAVLEALEYYEFDNQGELYTRG